MYPNAKPRISHAQPLKLKGLTQMEGWLDPSKKSLG